MLIPCRTHNIFVKEMNNEEKNRRPIKQDKPTGQLAVVALAAKQRRYPQWDLFILIVSYSLLSRFVSLLCSRSLPRPTPINPSYFRCISYQVDLS